MTPGNPSFVAPTDGAPAQPLKSRTAARNPLPRQKSASKVVKKDRRIRVGDVTAKVRAVIEKYPSDDLALEDIAKITNLRPEQIRQAVRRLVRVMPGLNVLKPGHLWRYNRPEETVKAVNTEGARVEEEHSHLRLTQYHEIGTLSTGVPLVESQEGEIFMLVPVVRVITNLHG